MSKPKKPTRHPWRENIEAFTMAVIIALLFKYFILEISKIPSGSMQPTLMGEPKVGIFDRVLVDKLSMHFRDPERFEIVVFKHPIERSRVMVKRLVGMPGEDLQVKNGDLWTRPDAQSEWTIVRRPWPVQQEMWRKLDPTDPSSSSWSVIEGGEGWKIRANELSANGAGTVAFRRGSSGIRNHYLDGYPTEIAKNLQVQNSHSNRYLVGDLRLEGKITAQEGTEAVVVHLSEDRQTYTFMIPGPAATQQEPTIAWRSGGSPGKVLTSDGPGERIVVAKERFRLPAGKSVRFAVQNLDDRIALEIDGDEVAWAEVEPVSRPEGGLSLEVRGSGAELTGLEAFRDIYYIADPKSGRRTWWTEIPAGHYVMLGDNAQDSADSRDWRGKVYEFETPDGETLRKRGNFREGENPARGTIGSEPARRFRDEWGEVHWFAERAGRPELEVHAPLVPRELIQGRAMAVFWPILPHRGIVRLTWLH